MASDKEDRIRERAYQIWEREGRPEGRQSEHWAQAAREIGNEDDAGAEASRTLRVSTDDDPTRTAREASRPAGAAGIASDLQPGGARQPGSPAPSQGGLGADSGPSGPEGTRRG